MVADILSIICFKENVYWVEISLLVLNTFTEGKKVPGRDYDWQIMTSRNLLPWGNRVPMGDGDWPRFIIFYYTWGIVSSWNFLARSRDGRRSFQLSPGNISRSVDAFFHDSCGLFIVFHPSTNIPVRP